MNGLNVSRNAVKSIILSAIILSISVGSAFAAAQRVSYERLEGLFLTGQFDTVVSESRALIDSGYGRREDIYYLRGLSELKLNRFADARESFGYITSKYPNSRKAFDARLGTGDSYMLAGELNSAVGIYLRMLDDFRSDKNLPVVYSRLASCYSGLGVRDKADYYRNMANQASPLSFEAKGQTAVAQTRTVVPSAQVAMAQARATASQVAVTQTRATAPQVAVVPKKTPMTNISPQVAIAPSPATASQVAIAQTRATASQTSEDMDVILATDKTISIQVGSFKNRRNAEKLARKLSSTGFESRVEIPVAEHDKLYRVKVGRVSSRAEAEALQARLKAAGYATKICDGEVCE